MNKNPFSSEALPSIQKENNKLNIYSSTNDVRFFTANKEDTVSKKEKSQILLKFASQKIVSATKHCFEQITNPLISKTKDTNTFFMANKSLLTGDDKHSEIYQLLNLIRNKKPNISHKAEIALEKKINDPEARKIILNHFNHNPKARAEFGHIYEKIVKLEQQK